MSDPFDWVGTWHVRHADGSEEDIKLEHGNLQQDATGTAGQFLLQRRVEAVPHRPGMLPQHGMMAELNGRHFAYLKLRPGAEPRWYELNVPPQDMPTVPSVVDGVLTQAAKEAIREDLARKGPLVDFEIDADGHITPKSARARAAWKQERDDDIVPDGTIVPDLPDGTIVPDGPPGPAREGKWTNIEADPSLGALAPPDGVASGETRNARITPLDGAGNFVTGVNGPNAKRLRDNGGEAEPCG